MKVSQLTKVMEKDDIININLDGAPIDKQLLYEGVVKGIHRDDPLNRAHITMLCAYDDEIIIEVRLAEGGKNEICVG